MVSITFLKKVSQQSTGHMLTYTSASGPGSSHTPQKAAQVGYSQKQKTSATASFFTVKF